MLNRITLNLDVYARDETGVRALVDITEEIAQDIIGASEYTKNRNVESIYLYDKEQTRYRIDDSILITAMKRILVVKDEVSWSSYYTQAESMRSNNIYTEKIKVNFIRHCLKILQTPIDSLPLYLNDEPKVIRDYISERLKYGA